jgi:ribosome maturation factor RimP
VVDTIKQKVEDLISDDASLYMVDVILKGNKGGQKLIVLIDGDKGLDIDKCAEISRKLGLQIEEENLIDSSYTLEVSSPGLDMPLKLERQYQKNIGRNLKIENKEGQQEKGKLIEVKEAGISLEIQKGKKKEVKEIDFKEINRTFVEVSFK